MLASPSTHAPLPRCRFLATILLALTPSLQLAAQTTEARDTVTLTSGKELRGRVVRQDSKEVILRTGSVDRTIARGARPEARLEVFGTEQLGDPEVEQLRMALGGHEHVGRLEVAVHDAAFVRPMHRIADSGEQREAPLQFERSREVVDPRALHELHYQEGPAVIGRPAVEQTGDPRVIEAREDPALTAEAMHERCRVHAAVEDLHRDDEFETCMPAHRPPDRAHATAADLLAQFVVADPQQIGRVGSSQQCVRRRAGQELGLRVEREQRSHFAAQAFVGSALLPQERVAFGARQRRSMSWSPSCLT